MRMGKPVRFLRLEANTPQGTGPEDTHIMTDESPIKDPTTGRFLTGNTGGGRPKGARSKLGEMFLEALHDDFKENGIAAIVQVRDERPQDYLRVIASLMPKDVNLNVNNMDDATDDELIQRLRDLDAIIRPFLGVEGSGNDSAGAGPPRPN